MTVLAVMHRNAQLRATLKRGLKGAPQKMVVFRSPGRIEQALEDELVDAVLVDVLHTEMEWCLDFIRRYPRIPLTGMSSFRPDDGRAIEKCMTSGFKNLMVEGVDDPVAAEILLATSASRERRSEMADGARLLRLSEPLQLQAWNEVLDRVASRAQTGEIANALGVSREHLSREFGAGGAPNLKRVIDLVRLTCAADLLRNPGYSVQAVAHVLRYASSSHLASSARRLADSTPSGLAELGPRGVFARFLAGRTRSRI